MGTTYRYSGKRVPVDTASGAIKSDAIVVQEGLFGVALGNATTGAKLWISIEGVHNLPVPSGTVKSDKLYIGAALTVENTDVTLTKTAAGGVLFGMAMSSRDGSGKALVLLASQMAAAAA